MAMFTATEKVKKSVSLINNLDASRFPALLARIVQKVHLKDEELFSEEECEKLIKVFKLSGSDLQEVIETCEFIIHQAAYHSAKPAVLAQQLKDIELAQDKIEAFVEVWSNSARDVLLKLRHHTVLSPQLEAVNWRLCLHMAHKSQADAKRPVAQLELKINDSAAEDKAIRLEFSHSELYAFYNQLETIQRQMDSLT